MNRIKLTDNDIVMALWETCERLRNKNNVIHVVANKSYALEVGNCLYYNKGAKGLSCWEITEVVEQKPSRLKNKNIWILKTKFNKITKSHDKANFFKGD